IYARTVGEHAAGAIEGSNTIHELREQVAASLVPDNLKRSTGAAAQRWYASLDAAGVITPGERGKYLAAADSARQAVENQARDAILATINDAQPLTGESWTDTQARVGRLVRDAAGRAGRDMLDTPNGPSFTDVDNDPEAWVQDALVDEWNTT